MYRGLGFRWQAGPGRYTQPPVIRGLLVSGAGLQMRDDGEQGLAVHEGMHKLETPGKERF